MPGIEVATIDDGSGWYARTLDLPHGPGVARVEISGAAPSEVEIAVDPERLSAHGVSLNALANALRSVNFSVSAGLIDDGGQRLRQCALGVAQHRGAVLDGDGLRLPPRDVAAAERPAAGEHRAEAVRTAVLHPRGSSGLLSSLVDRLGRAVPVGVFVVAALVALLVVGLLVDSEAGAALGVVVATLVASTVWWVRRRRTG